MRDNVHRAIDWILQTTNKRKDEGKMILPSNTLWAGIVRERQQTHHRRFPHFHPRILCHLPTVGARMQICACVWLRRRKVCPGGFRCCKEARRRKEKSTSASISTVEILQLVGI